MSTLYDFSRHLAELFPRVGTPAFASELVGLLKSLIPIEDATIIVYEGGNLPVLEYFDLIRDTGSTTLDRYLQGAFLLDPFYLAAAREQRYGAFRLRDLAPEGFKDSEYYSSWYRKCGYKDECGYIFPLRNEGFVNIALGRTTPRTTFSKAHMAVLRDIAPTIQALCHAHWAEPSHRGTGPNLRAQLHKALDGFGSSMLTERESQVINLVLHGHSTKTIAEKLSISVETVKLHRKHAYAKLEVSSQAELFYLFLDALMSAKDYDGGDTLVAYLQPPESRRSDAH
ncbi:MAG: helix-turn-helix transcriptional regulator [Halieaceae bacterium]|nr:helix-turn-helix transcriptional regulator [Halieaceae bacterium]